MKKSSQNKNPLITVIIPVKNGMSTLKSCLDGLFSQTLIDLTEIIIIDSGSTDGTLDLLKEYPLTIHSIDPKDFNHGDTRNLGVKLAKGDFVFMSVQDATPTETDFLEKMLSNFDDPEVSGVCGQQFTKHDIDKNPLQWFRPIGEADKFKVQFKNPEDFTSLSGKKQLEYCGWDDVVAMYRKSMKEELPFRKIQFGEDALWAKDALSKGYAIAFDRSARVYHYHHQNYTFYFKRTFIIQYVNYKFFNTVLYSEFLLKAIVFTTYRILKMPLSFKRKMYWWFYNMRIHFARYFATNIMFLVSKLFGIKGVEKALKIYVNMPPQGVQAKTKN